MADCVVRLDAATPEHPGVLDQARLSDQGAVQRLLLTLIAVEAPTVA
ncbi:MAG: hypothetical protein JWP31_1380 [Aeromicrobium sp.]|nr:hypothetical protein [Aeromicrobium sp.]